MNTIIAGAIDEKGYIFGMNKKGFNGPRALSELFANPHRPGKLWVDLAAIPNRVVPIACYTPVQRVRSVWAVCYQ